MKLGRMGRKSYFVVMVVYSFLYVLLFSAPTLAVLSFVLNLLFIPFVIKRLHDLGSTGWLAVVAVIPVIGIILSGALLLQSGENRTNKYGPPTTS